MNEDFAVAMRLATLSTRARNVVEATRIIQDALAERQDAFAEPRRPDPSEAHVETIAPPPHSLRCRRLIDPDAEIIEPSSEPANPAASSGEAEIGVPDAKPTPTMSAACLDHLRDQSCCSCNPSM